jgi:hypothetical protein
LDFSLIGDAILAQGANGSLYVTAGAPVLLKVTQVQGPGRANLSATITRELDAYEPNEGFAEAAPIPVGSAITAQYITKHIDGANNVPDDWYAIDLEAGTTTVSLTDVPENVRFGISSYDSNRKEEQLAITALGVLGSWSFEVTTAGTYYLEFHEPVGILDAFFSGAKPAHLDASYTFIVTQ